MANEWYYTKDDGRQGPVSADELKRLAQAGEISADDLVWKDGMDDWRPAGQLKGLFGDGPAAAPLNPAASTTATTRPPSGERSPAFQFVHVCSALLLIIAMFLPWWSVRLTGTPREVENAFSKEVQAAGDEPLGKSGPGNGFPRRRQRARREPDKEKIKKLLASTGWYVRSLGSLSVHYESYPDTSSDPIDVRAKIWGWHLGLALAAAFFGFAVVPLAFMMIVWRDARRFSWATSFLFAYLSLILCLMTVMWYFESPGYDVSPVFSQGAHVGPYLVMGGCVLLLTFGLIDGILGLQWFARKRKEPPE